MDNSYNDNKNYKSHNRQSGGYKELPFFKQSEIIYDFTYNSYNYEKFIFLIPKTPLMR